MSANVLNETASLNQLQIAEKELTTLEQKKKQIDRELIALETQIYRLETSYLQETAIYGNIIRGFEGFLSKGSLKSSSGYSNNKSGLDLVNENERLFSRSSVTYEKALEHYERDETIRQNHPEYQFDTGLLAPIIGSGQSSLYGSHAGSNASLVNLDTQKRLGGGGYPSSNATSLEKDAQPRVHKRKATGSVKQLFSSASYGSNSDDDIEATDRVSNPPIQKRKKKREKKEE